VAAPPTPTSTVPTGAPIIKAPTAGTPVTEQVSGARGPLSEPPAPDDEVAVSKATPSRAGKPRVRKVRRIVRHIEPWSVLKLSVLFYAALFLIVSVAFGVLWGAARATGVVDNVESFVTGVGGFGNCEPIDGAASATTTTRGGTDATGPVDQLDPAESATTLPDPGAPGAASPGDETDCREGERLVGEFQFEDVRIFLAFVLGGVVLVLAGSAANVVLVLLFNMMSDITGGLRLTVLEEEPSPAGRPASGSPPPRRGD